MGIKQKSLYMKMCFRFLGCENVSALTFSFNHPSCECEEDGEEKQKTGRYFDLAQSVYTNWHLQLLAKAFFLSFFFFFFKNLC